MSAMFLNYHDWLKKKKKKGGIFRHRKWLQLSTLKSYSSQNVGLVKERLCRTEVKSKIKWFLMKTVVWNDLRNR